MVCTPLHGFCRRHIMVCLHTAFFRAFNPGRVIFVSLEPIRQKSRKHQCTNFARSSGFRMRFHVVRARLILKSQNLAPGPGSRQQTEPSSDLEVQLRSFAVPITSISEFLPAFSISFGSTSGTKRFIADVAGRTFPSLRDFHTQIVFWLERD